MVYSLLWVVQDFVHQPYDMIEPLQRAALKEPVIRPKTPKKHQVGTSLDMFLGTFGLK